MATHSSVLDRRIPETGELGGLPSIHGYSLSYLKMNAYMGPDEILRW